MSKKKMKILHRAPHLVCKNEPHSGISLSLFLEWTERCAEEIRHVEKENENITPRASLGLQERTAFRNLLVLFVKDAERVFESFDLGLTARHALLVGHARVNASRTKLLQRLEGLIQELLRGCEVVERGDEASACALQGLLGLLQASLLGRD